MLQEPLCLPDQLGDIKEMEASFEDEDCLDACNGLFADVRLEQNETRASFDFKTIVEDYVRYKENYAQNVEFNSSLESTSYGRFNQGYEFWTCFFY